ncbi:hypothetical protein Ssi03_41790 [Sphaerisporangium siamense]|uniref:Uncharacterized protein n=1 Tax=Sphaerisporangium siamense TaxID=795645 RepID=A0A7W7GF02_9ACTN|nr:hypothetical protein [Sphaerisporangium siamense]GII86189.1 hypothetical protein Ssi03_41790 [Sphaerisporangium siamense]
MAVRTRQSPRRRQGLTQERIVETAVEPLDETGKDALKGYGPGAGSGTFMASGRVKSRRDPRFRGLLPSLAT